MIDRIRKMIIKRKFWKKIKKDFTRVDEWVAEQEYFALYTHNTNKIIRTLSTGMYKNKVNGIRIIIENSYSSDPSVVEDKKGDRLFVLSEIQKGKLMNIRFKSLRTKVEDNQIARLSKILKSEQ